MEGDDETQLEADFVKPGKPSWSPEGDYIAVVDEYHLLQVWSFPVLQVWSFPGLERTTTIMVRGEQLGEPLWTGVQNEVAALSFAGSSRVGVRVSDVTSGEGIKAVDTGYRAVNDAAWSPDGKWLAIAIAGTPYLSGENGVTLFDGDTLQERTVLPLAETLFDGKDDVAFRKVSWSADGEYVIIQDSLGGWVFWPNSRLDPLAVTE